MELVKVLGVDPSLRNTGVAVITYNTELSPSDPQAFTISNCQTLVNPKKYTGTEGILNMLDMISTESQKQCYKDPEIVLVESPPIMFNKAWSGGTISLISHIAGGAVALFGIEKCHLFRPHEWNKTRKKEITHNQTVAFLGNPDLWHYEKRIKSEKEIEHILDAASIALWWIKSNYIDE